MDKGNVFSGNTEGEGTGKRDKVTIIDGPRSREVEAFSEKATSTGQTARWK